jgi:hypothetical protein
MKNSPVSETGPYVVVVKPAASVIETRTNPDWMGAELLGAVPVTMKSPWPSGLMTPAEVVPFPQLIVAEKSVYKMTTASRKAVLSPPAESNPWKVIVCVPAPTVNAAVL